MPERERIINIAVIAHVDAGKSTLVDALLSQAGIFKEHERVVDCVLDTNDLERERGITIYSKNCSLQYRGTKINIVDTPGHSDFSSEVERIIKTVDTAILLVDSSEGPMPQTRFVLQKSLALGLKPILFINKMDKKDQRAREVMDMVLDLFIDLQANDEQLDFPVLYGVAKKGLASKSIKGESKDLTPLFETILEHVDPYPDYSQQPLQMQISDLAYDDYIGRLGIGRVSTGTVKEGQRVSVTKSDRRRVKGSISRVFVYRGLKQVQVTEARSGDIAVIAGLEEISIGEVVCDEDQESELELIEIEKPTLSMNFSVNDSPLSGRSGDYLTSRQIKARLERELEVNVGLEMEVLAEEEAFKVSGRGELHLSILLENMRREGYELSLSKPEVLMKKEEGTLLEPVERVIIETPEEYSGSVISKLNARKGIMQAMSSNNNPVRLEYLAPTRGLLGYRSEFVNDTRGEGTMVRSFEKYDAHKGSIPERENGVLISMQSGTAKAYALDNLSQRATLFIGPGTKVYEGMIVGINSRSEDLSVNPCKNKKLTNVRAAGSDESISLPPPKKLNLEEALEFIALDELVEITPDDIRLRKKILKETERKRKG